MVTEKTVNQQAALFSQTLKQAWPYNISKEEHRHVKAQLFDLFLHVVDEFLRNMTKEFTGSNLGIACHFSLSALNTTFSQYATTCFTFSIKTICELYEKCESLEKYPSNTTLEREMQVIMLCFVFEAILIRNSAITYLNTNW